MAKRALRDRGFPKEADVPEIVLAVLAVAKELLKRKERADEQEA